MNNSTGEVVSESELEARLAAMTEPQRVSEKHRWTRFAIDELIKVKGLTFRVHDVSDQRLVLKFQGD